MDTLVCAGAFAAAYLLARRSPQGGGDDDMTYRMFLEALGYSLEEEKKPGKKKKLIATKSFVASSKTDERNGGRPGWEALKKYEGLDDFQPPTSFDQTMVLSNGSSVAVNPGDSDSDEGTDPPGGLSDEPAQENLETAGNPAASSEVYGVKLTRDDLDSLDDEEWLDDKVIDAYLKILEARNGTDGYNDVWFCGPTDFQGHESTLKSKRAIERKGKKAKEREEQALSAIQSGLESVRNVTDWTSKLVFVCNVRENHWCVVAVVGDEAYYLDSLYQHTRKKVKYPDNIDTTISTILDASLIFKELECNNAECKCGGVTVPQQENDYDCGVFALAMAEAFQKTGTLELRFNQGQAARFRAYLKNVLTNFDPENPKPPFEFGK